MGNQVTPGRQRAVEGSTRTSSPHPRALCPPIIPPPALQQASLRVFIYLSPPSSAHPQGYEVDIYESRPWIGGKVASFKDKDGNDIEMGLHVFFGGWPSPHLYLVLFWLAAGGAELVGH